MKNKVNPKRLSELAESLRDLRAWALIEAKSCDDESERAINKVWHEVIDWADGRALRHKLNIDDGMNNLRRAAQ